jgi:hypothetical protein
MIFFSAEAVRMRFGYKEEDMISVWASIRTSLVQKVTDVRKSNKRKSQLEQTPQQLPNLSSQQDPIVIDETNSQTKVNQLEIVANVGLFENYR